MTSRLSFEAAPDAAALYQVIREVRRLFHRLASGADRLHADLGVSVAQRAVLEALADAGSSTVPALARGKGVSRQHIQVLANELLAAGLVETRDNPAHRRSPLLDLSSAGRRIFEAMRAREVRLLASAVERLAPRRLDQVAGALRDIGDAVEASLGRRPTERRRATRGRPPAHDRRLIHHP